MLSLGRRCGWSGSYWRSRLRSLGVSWSVRSEHNPAQSEVRMDRGVGEWLHHAEVGWINDRGIGDVI